MLSRRVNCSSLAFKCIDVSLPKNTKELMAPTFYMHPASPPARAVLMTAKYLNLDMELKTINPMAGEHKTQEYLEMNPQGTVLTFKDDDGFILCDSHAIMPYLIEKYGRKDDPLYPRDYKKRAAINQRLHFDSGLFLPRLRKVLRQAHFQKDIDPAALESLNEVYGYLEKFLENGDFVAGDSLSVADLSLIACVSSEQALGGSVDYEKYPKIQEWIKTVEAVPCFAANKEALEGVKKAFK